MKQLLSQSSMISILLIIFSDTLANNEKIFRGCIKTGYHFNNGFLVLKPHIIEVPQTIFFIQNNSPGPIKLTSKKAKGWTYIPHTNKIAAKKWAAFSTDDEELTFACYKARTEKSSIDCQTNLNICQYTDTKFPRSNNGSYWAIKSEPLKKARRAVIKQGVLLRW